MTEDRGYTEADEAAVLDSPEWTKQDFAQAKRGRDVLPREFLANRGREVAGVVDESGGGSAMRLPKSG